MVVQNFLYTFSSAQQVLNSIAMLAHEAGEHFNEAQTERAHKLTVQLDREVEAACDKAHELLDAKPEEAPSAPDVDADGEAPKIVGQGSQIGLGAHTDPITRSAVASIEAHLEERRNKDGIPFPGITTEATGAVVDQPKGDTLELAGSEGDISLHNTGDGSRMIHDASAAEAVKILTADVATQAQPSILHPGENTAIQAAQGPAGDSSQFTASPTADQPADTAAVHTGEQEIAVPPEESPR